MADADAIWFETDQGLLRGFHESCAAWLELEGSVEGRDAYHTEICRGCGGFLLGPAPERHGPKPAGLDARQLLL